MSDKLDIREFIINMFSTEKLGQEEKLNELLNIFELNKEFIPTHWGTNERVRLEYDREEILKKVLIEGRTTIYVHRNKSPKYTGYFDTETDNIYITFFNLEFNKSMAKKYRERFFNFADEIAKIIKPSFGVVSIVWDLPYGWNNEHERLREWMFYGSQAVPSKFFGYGPKGVAMKTYFSDDVVKLFTREMLLNSPAIVSELDWGGICINLSPKPWEEASDNLLQTWLDVMKHLEPAQVFAVPKFIDNNQISFSANYAWKNKDEILIKNNLNHTSNIEDEIENIEIVEETDAQKVLNEIHEAISNKETLEYFDIESVDLSFSDLSYVQAECLTLEKVNLRASSFTNVNFFDCTIDESNLESCDFEDARIADCYFTDSNFKMVNMKDVIMNISFCTGSSFDEADFSNGELRGTCIDKASIKNAKLRMVDATMGSFAHSDLTGADLSKGKFKKCSFSNANLTKTNLSNGNFQEANFTNTKLEEVIWKGANIKNAIFDPGVREKIEKLI